MQAQQTQLPFETDDSWKEFARCNDGTGGSADVFFSERHEDILRAQAICSRCMVKVECNTAAKERREPWGVWGGELFVRGRARAVMMRGRPPITPRPKVEIDEAPLPEDWQRLAS